MVLPFFFSTRLLSTRHGLDQGLQVVAVVHLLHPGPQDFHLQLGYGDGPTFLKLSLHPGPTFLYGADTQAILALGQVARITPTETVVHPLPDAATAHNLFMCILLDTAI